MKQTYPDYLSAYSGPTAIRQFSAQYEKFKFTFKIQRRKWEVMATDLKWVKKKMNSWVK